MDMVKRVIVALALVLVASVPAHADELKVGVINMQRALNDTDEGKKALERLKSKLESEGKSLKSRQEELKKMQDDLNQKGYMLSEPARAEKQEKFKLAVREFQKNAEEKQGEFDTQFKEVTNKILKKLMEILKDYAKAEGLTVVLDSSPRPNGVPGEVVWNDNKVDITNKVIELYNAAAKAPDKQ